MNNEDKILLMAYVDGELDNTEVLRAEALMSSNRAAMNFANQLKTANSSIQAAYQTSEYHELDKRLDAFVNKNFKKDKASITELISSFFLSRQTLNYSLTAMLFLSIGVFYDDYFLDSNTSLTLQKIGISIESEPALKISAIELSEKTLKIPNFDLKPRLHTKVVFKTRGVNENNLFKIYLKETIIEMLELRSSEGILKYGSDTYAIFLQEKLTDKETYKCYSGVIYLDGAESKILFCNSENDASLIYTD